MGGLKVTVRFKKCERNVRLDHSLTGGEVPNHKQVLQVKGQIFDNWKSLGFENCYLEFEKCLFGLNSFPG